MPVTDERNPYEILQVVPSAEASVIEGVYKALVKKYHPDANPGTDTTAKMQDINWAHDILSDPVKRKDYDRKLQQRAASSAAQPWQAARPAKPTGAAGPPPPGANRPGSTPGSGPKSTGSTGSQRTTGSSTWGTPRPSGDSRSDSRGDRYRDSSSDRYGTRPDDRPFTRPGAPRPDAPRPGAPRPASAPPDDRPFARASRGEPFRDPPPEEMRRATPMYQRPYERYATPRGTAAKGNAVPKGGAAARPAAGAQDTSTRGSTSRRDSNRSTPGEPSAESGRTYWEWDQGPNPWTEPPARPRWPSANPFGRARPVESTQRSAPRAFGGAIQRETLIGVRTDVARWLRANPRAVAATVGSILLALFLLAAALNRGGGGEDPTGPPAQQAVNYGMTQVPGHWIMIYEEPYRASIQAAVNEAAQAGNFAPPQVVLGGYVFADAQTRTTGYYCPPTGPFAGAGTLPNPPPVLDSCLPVLLSAELTGYTSRK